MTNKSFLALSVFFIFVNLTLHCQDYYLFHSSEDSLKSLSKQILYGGNNQIKSKANEQFSITLERALKHENSFEYPFDSLVSVSKLVSPDKSFRIFNWTLLSDNGTYRYFGFIQLNNKSNSIQKVIKLTDNSDSIHDPQNKALSNTSWYGAIYYKIIYNRYKGNKYYTLLGWKGNNSISKKKVIDVLTFNSDFKPVFGCDIFKTRREEPKRVIFEYSYEAVMSLKYEEQYYNKIKGQSIYAYDKLKNIRKEQRKKSGSANSKKHKKKKAWMIVFDRLIPLNPGLEGEYQFYVPSTDDIDGFIFREGKWRMIENVDARNPKDTKKLKEHKQKDNSNLFQLK